MIPPTFDYAAPTSVAEAVQLLAQNADAKILAGGQSLIPMMRFGLASPALLVDLNRVDGLEAIREEDGWLKLGALTREAALEQSALVSDNYPLQTPRHVYRSFLGGRQGSAHGGVPRRAVLLLRV